MSTTTLFSPGPVMVHESVRNALMHNDICHRAREFEDMFIDTQHKLKKLCQADESYYSVIISGSGTAANECVLSSAVSSGGKVLLIKNGMFSERLEDLLAKHKIDTVKVEFAWGEYPDVGKIEAAMAANPDAELVSMVMHETSTGMINPVERVGELCVKYGKKLHVDCVSAVGGEDVNVVKQHIDFLTSVAGKCLGAFPGSAFIVAKEKYLAEITEEQCRSVYLNLHRHYKFAVQAHQTPNTPNVTLFWALNQAVTNILEEGVDAYVARHAEMARIIREGVKEMGLRILMTEHASNTVTSVFVPDDIDVKTFIDDLEGYGYTVYLGKGDYASNMFQIGNMGHLTPEQCYAFLDAMRSYLKLAK